MITASQANMLKCAFSEKVTEEIINTLDAEIRRVASLGKSCLEVFDDEIVHLNKKQKNRVINTLKNNGFDVCFETIGFTGFLIKW